MYKTVGLWFILGVCVLVVGYTVFLLAANASRESRLSLYPWPSGDVAPIWVLVAALVAGMVLIPSVRLLVRTIRGLRAVRQETAEAKAKRDQADAGAGGL
jgi:hypothetical protein